MGTNGKLTIEIVEIEPVAVYKDTVYDQTVVARLHDGNKIKLYDATVSVENDNIGDVLDVSVQVLPLPPSDVKNVSEMALGIHPLENPSSEWSYGFVGDISDIGDDLIIIDIGIGEVALSIAELNDEMKRLVETDDITPGDRLYVPGRADLSGVN